MKNMTDIICQVYAGEKSKFKIDLVLAMFVPGCDELNLDYASRPDDESYIFKTEHEMINYFIDNSGVEQTFYWNKYHDNPDKIMVGANITNDDKLIISLTLDGNEGTATSYLNRLKAVWESTVGVISYTDPVEYDNGEDFISKYS